MNDALKMQISAFVDGELPAAEAELLTRRLAQDADLRRQAGHYLAIGRMLRGERELDGAAELRTRIAAVIDAEPLPTAATPSPDPRWLRPATGVAIAASVAVLALVGLRQMDPADTVPVATPDTLVADDVSYTEPSVSDVVADRPGDMLRQYYLSHGATSGELGANGILSRLVTLELRGGELVEVPASDAAMPAADDLPRDAQDDAAGAAQEQ